MNKYKILIILFLVILVCGCAQNNQAGEIASNIEYIGGKYNLTLNITEAEPANPASTMKKIQYVKDNNTIDPNQILPDSMRPGLNWLKENTSENATIMSWWDYGHAIRAYAEREPVADAPSRKILVTTVSMHLGKSPEDIDCPNCIDHQIIQDITAILLSEKSQKPQEIMKKYNAQYLYVHSEDEFKSGAFYVAQEMEFEPVSLKTLLGKALAREPIDRFNLVYEDITCRIYELID